jgi:hypothetical protein
MENLPAYDCHCHILPGLDDGAQTLSDTEALLDANAEQGVGEIVFTPHFSAPRISYFRSPIMRTVCGSVTPKCYRHACTTSYFFERVPSNSLPQMKSNFPTMS